MQAAHFVFSNRETFRARSRPVKRLWLTHLLLLASCGPGPDWSEPFTPTPAPASAPRPLHTEGARLLDDTGAEVHLRGLNVCAFEFDATGATWQLEPDGGSRTLDVLSNPTRWNVNVVRVPVNQEWFLTDDDYVARVEQVLDAAALRGVYVIIDLQWEHAQPTDPYQLNILREPTFGEGNTSERFWHRASGRWANREHVLFDLINEPHDTPPDQLAVAMQRLINDLAQRAPNIPLIIGGPAWAHSVASWSEHPLHGANLLYSAHEYLPYDPPSSFEAQFEQPARTLPVLLGEFDGREQLLDDGTRYQQVLLERAEAAGVDGWLSWAIGCELELDDDLDGGVGGFLAERLRALNTR